MDHRAAVVANHRAWFAATARALGGSVVRERGTAMALTPGVEAVVPFPRLPRDTPGPVLDALLDQARDAEVRSVSVWCATPDGPRGLGARLAARGFEYGWRAHWMRASTDVLADAPVPEGVSVAVDERTDETVPGLPYWSDDGARTLGALFAARPRRTWRVVARDAGQAVLGHVVFFVAPGLPAVAGIYDMGVLPDARRRGIGRALLRGAFDAARERGCTDALLNSAASDFYRAVGFTHVGFGQTFWLHRPTLESGPVPPERVAFAEGIGLGETDSLERVRPENLDAPLAGGMTPMELAVRTRKAASVAWLRERGAFFGPLHAWDLGWRAAAARVLRENPSSANRRAGAWGLTPLHEAVQRDDRELARLILSANPDLDIKDTQFGGTPRSWARHLARPEIGHLIDTATGGTP